MSEQATGRPSALVGALFAWWAVVLIPVVDQLVGLRTTLEGMGVVTLALVLGGELLWRQDRPEIA